ncbi:MAG: polymer-forming cytoskeletal protein [bacterium]|jgi:cytoskeletal protein CcmA (bactofilin family)|nr:polymer-forming cytoskeletal protein [bacterium]
MVDFSFTEDDLDSSQQEEIYASSPDAPTSYIAEDMVMEGTLAVKYGMEIAGSFQGDLYSQTRMKIAPTGRVEGKMEAFDIVIEGIADATVTARKCLEIHKGGHFIGTMKIQPEIIRLSEFAIFGDTEDAADASVREYSCHAKSQPTPSSPASPETASDTPPAE